MADLTREFVEKIEEMTGFDTIQEGGHTYTNKRTFLVKDPIPESIQIHTLTGFVDFVKSKMDYIDNTSHFIVIESPTKVKLYSKLTPDNERECLLVSDAAAYLPGIPFDRMIDRERFNIIVQSGFSDSYDKDKVLAAIGNMRLENSVQVQDDGVTQTVASKSGVVVVEKKNIPNPVTLAPYRTFAEIMQPASRFILRVGEDGNVGLFEADGGEWRNEAIRLINDYLFIKLNGDISSDEYFTIIA